MITQKKRFDVDAFTFQTGKTIPITLGYETFGTISEKKDNVILVIHYFSATSHCAGKYDPNDALSGYWDSLIGPGKAVDTNEFFVISSDNLCNCGANNPMVYTTGPKSIDPETGTHYGLEFPLPSVLDVINAQKLLLESLGITHVKAIMGPSFGAMSAYQWAVSYPAFMDGIVTVVGSPIHPTYGAFSPLQHGIRVAKLDPYFANGQYYGNENQPLEGLRLAMQMMNVAAFTPAFYETTYGRDRGEQASAYDHIFGKTSFEEKLERMVELSVPTVDLNHWIYTCRMCMNYDISRSFGGDLDRALSQIQAKVLAIPCKQDLLHPWTYVQTFIDTINRLGGHGQLYPIDHESGHMAGIVHSELFAQRVNHFIKQEL